MIHQQILDYARQQLIAQVPKEQILKTLEAQGWQKADIEEVFAVLERHPVSTTPPTSSPASQTQPPPNQLIQPPTANASTIMPRVAVGVVVLMIVSGVAYAYTTGALASLTGYIPFFSSAPYEKSQVLIGVIDGLGKIQTSSWSIDLSVKTEPRDAGVSPLPKSTSTQRDISLGDIAAYIPSDFSAMLHIDAATQKNDTSIDGQGSLSFDVTSADFSMSFAAELRKLGDNFYLDISKVPGLFGGGFSALKNKWIVITPQDQKNYGSTFSVHAETFDKEDAQRQQALEDLKTLLQIEHNDAVLTSATPVHDNVDGKSMYRYDLSLNAAAVPEFYSDAMQAFAHSTTTGKSFDKETLTYLQSEDGKALTKYLAQNLFIRIWIDSAGIPRKFEVLVRVVPDDTVKKLAGKQVVIDGNVLLQNINQKITIETPSPTMSADEAYSLSTGESLQQLKATQVKSRDARRISDANSTMIALELYYDSNNRYPSTLSALVPTYKSSIQTDPIDGTSYQYVSSGSSYTLKINLESNNSVNTTYAKRIGTLSSVSCNGTAGRYCLTVTH